MSFKADEVCVITGDLIKSSRLTRAQKDALPIALNNALRGQTGIILPLAFFQGDGLQLLCETDSAIRLVLLIESTIKDSTGTLARMALGIGLTDKIDKSGVRQSSGEAFTLSEEQLGSLKAEKRIFKIRSKDSAYNENLDTIAIEIEQIIENWSEKEATEISKAIQENACHDKLSEVMKFPLTRE